VLFDALRTPANNGSRVKRLPEELSAYVGIGFFWILEVLRLLVRTPIKDGS
jgi:hypothetical protein